MIPQNTLNDDIIVDDVLNKIFTNSLKAVKDLKDSFKNGNMEYDKRNFIKITQENKIFFEKGFNKHNLDNKFKLEKKNTQIKIVSPPPKYSRYASMIPLNKKANFLKENDFLSKNSDKKKEFLEKPNENFNRISNEFQKNNQEKINNIIDEEDILEESDKIEKIDFASERNHILRIPLENKIDFAKEMSHSLRDNTENKINENTQNVNEDDKNLDQENNKKEINHKYKGKNDEENFNIHHVINIKEIPILKEIINNNIKEDAVILKEDNNIILRDSTNPKNIEIDEGLLREKTIENIKPEELIDRKNNETILQFKAEIKTIDYIKKNNLNSSAIDSKILPQIYNNEKELNINSNNENIIVYNHFYETKTNIKTKKYQDPIDDLCNSKDDLNDHELLIASNESTPIIDKCNNIEKKNDPSFVGKKNIDEKIVEIQKKAFDSYQTCFDHKKIDYLNKNIIVNLENKDSQINIDSNDCIDILDDNNLKNVNEEIIEKKEDNKIFENKINILMNQHDQTNQNKINSFDFQESSYTLINNKTNDNLDNPMNKLINFISNKSDESKTEINEKNEIDKKEINKEAILNVVINNIPILSTNNESIIDKLEIMDIQTLQSDFRENNNSLKPQIDELTHPNQINYINSMRNFVSIESEDSKSEINENKEINKDEILNVVTNNIINKLEIFNTHSLQEDNNLLKLKIDNFTNPDETNLINELTHANQINCINPMINFISNESEESKSEINEKNEINKDEILNVVTNNIPILSTNNESVINKLDIMDIQTIQSDFREDNNSVIPQIDELIQSSETNQINNFTHPNETNCINPMINLYSNESKESKSEINEKNEINKDEILNVVTNNIPILSTNNESVINKLDIMDIQTIQSDFREDNNSVIPQIDELIQSSETNQINNFTHPNESNQINELTHPNHINYINPMINFISNQSEESKSEINEKNEIICEYQKMETQTLQSDFLEERNSIKSEIDELAQPNYTNQIDNLIHPNETNYCNSMINFITNESEKSILELNEKNEINKEEILNVAANNIPTLSTNKQPIIEIMDAEANLTKKEESDIFLELDNQTNISKNFNRDNKAFKEMDQIGKQLPKISKNIQTNLKFNSKMKNPINLDTENSNSKPLIGINLKPKNNKIKKIIIEENDSKPKKIQSRIELESNKPNEIAIENKIPTLSGVILEKSNEINTEGISHIEQNIEKNNLNDNNDNNKLFKSMDNVEKINYYLISKRMGGDENRSRLVLWKKILPELKKSKNQFSNSNTMDPKNKKVTKKMEKNNYQLEDLYKNSSFFNHIKSSEIQSNTILSVFKSKKFLIKENNLDSNLLNSNNDNLMNDNLNNRIKKTNLQKIFKLEKKNNNLLSNTTNGNKIKSK